MKKIFNSIFKMSYKDFLINNDGKLLNLIEEDAMVFKYFIYSFKYDHRYFNFFITIGIMLFLNSTLSIIFILIFQLQVLYIISQEKIEKNNWN